MKGDVQLFSKLTQPSLRLFLSLDTVVLLLHLLLGSSYLFFHLDHEQNFPTYYQGLKLIFVGVYGLLLLATRQGKGTQLPWPLLASIAAVLPLIGLDEMFQIHENIYRLFENTPWLHPSNVVSFSQSFGFRSSLWLLYYSPLLLAGMLWFGYWLRALQQLSYTSFRTLLTALFCFFIVILMEVLSSTGEFWGWQYQLLVFVEEASEILGGTYLAVFLLEGLRSRK